MALPDIQSILLPFLKFAASRDQVSTTEAYKAMTAYFNLSAEDLDHRLPSGVAPAFYNTVAWAKQHLTFARLVEPIRRGAFRATDLGRHWAGERTESLKLSDLKTIPGYEERRRGQSSVVVEEERGRGQSSLAVEAAEPVATAPIERIEEAHAELRQATVTALLDRIAQKPPVFLEKLVIKLMAKLGYGDGTPESMLHTGGTGDKGIDGKIKMDKLGLDHVFLQMKCKKEENTVSRDQVSSFAGSIKGAKGVFVTTSTFTKQAREFIASTHPNIVLVDGQKLGELMLAGGLGVSVKHTYVLHDIDEDFFAEDD